MAPLIEGWLLCGGEGRRMGHQDKGLVPMQGKPLAAWLIERLTPQLAVLSINANRNLERYAHMLTAHERPPTVWPDDPDLGAYQGPLSGIVTAMRHTASPLVMFASCDTPHLPADLVERLAAARAEHDSDVAVPVTVDPDGTLRHHWVCVLIHRRCHASLEEDVRNGERRVGQWIQRQRWIGVSFPDATAFLNVNTPEVLHGQA